MDKLLEIIDAADLKPELKQDCLDVMDAADGDFDSARQKVLEILTEAVTADAAAAGLSLDPNQPELKAAQAKFEHDLTTIENNYRSDMQVIEKTLDLLGRKTDGLKAQALKKSI